MSFKALPRRVKVGLFEYWTGVVVAGFGVLGFIASFFEVGSPAQAAVDVHTEVPVLANISIAAWVVGIVLMWHARRGLTAAIRARSAENLAAASLDPGDAQDTPAATGVSDGGADDIRDASAARADQADGI